MEQKESMIDKDIELTVVLPGDIIKSTTVHGSKPMMDLLIFLCAQYHLNPSSYTIDLLSAEKNPIKFKPNTPIGMLEVEKVILRPKVLDKRKPTPIIPEKTVRVVINFKKTQKAIVRVSPHASLQELAPIICSKCEFDPLHTLLLKDYQSQEPLDLTKSLNDLGLRELYAMDISRATSVTASNKSSLQESCQISQNFDIMKEKENKKFFSFFQRSKKKRDQTASAPATPLVSNNRPTFTRSNTISKTYISNTLPSDAPKKRRAPLPPMSASQSVPQNLAHVQERPAYGVMKSMSVDETDKSSCGADIVRTGSLKLSSTSIGNSSLKRTKRKAPSPPSQIPLHQSDESHMTALRSVPTDSVSEASSPEGLLSPDFPSLAEASLGPGLPSHEQCTVPKGADDISLVECPETPEAAAASLTSGVSSDYSLEEIEEKEELSEVPKDEAENISGKSQDIPFGPTDIINTLKSDPDSALGSDTGESSQNSKDEKQETRNTDGQEPHLMVYNPRNEERVVDNVRNLKSLGPSQGNVDQNEITVTSRNAEDHMKDGVRRTEINGGGVAKNNNVDMEVDRLQAHKTETARRDKENHLAASSEPGPTLNQPRAEKTKMQDAAIQATPFCNSFDGTHRHHHLSDFKVDESVQTASNNKSTQHSSLSPQGSVDTSREFRRQGPLTVHSEDQLTMKDSMYAHGNDAPVDEINKNSTASYMKNYPLHRQDYNPKPKPSNEITREYIPKIGMTTYKIVPPKSLEIVKDGETETLGYEDDQDRHSLGKKHMHENVKETAMQTEDFVISEIPKEPQLDLKPKPALRSEHKGHSVEGVLHSPAANPLKPTPRMTRDTGTAPFVPNLEDINNILESRLKSRASNPQAKPSSFFLQMQKRASGQYVTSAAAKSVHTAPHPAPQELPKKEVERDPRPPPEPTPSPSSQTARSPPQPHVKDADGGLSSQKPPETSPPPPPVAPKPVSLPTSQLAALNLKTLTTFGAPRPYSSSAPSPFALAVVKRSQSFSKVRTESCSEGASAPAPSGAEEGERPAVDTPVDAPQLGVSNKENNSAHSERNSQIPSPTDCPPFTLKRQSSLTFQSSDPEEFRQSLLTAIRSGEAAAKLKRVTVPSNTISMNGKSRLSHSMSLDAQDGH
ncbi:cordon-bleu protein-like 1 isoform X10 [Myotis myotis]|nr:cordon-bleu protein-like 1 isoform X10 [Myotis myotis]